LIVIIALVGKTENCLHRAGGLLLYNIIKKMKRKKKIAKGR